MSNSKLTRSKESLIKLLDGSKTLEYISKKLTISESSIRAFSKANNLTYYKKHDLSSNLKIKILELLHEGLTYVEIGKTLKITTGRVEAFAHKNGIYKYDKERSEMLKELANNINLDLKNNFSYEEIIKKHNLTLAIRGELRRFGLEPLAKTFKKIRDSEITSQYKIKIAKDVLKDDNKNLESPNKITSEHNIYTISSSNGFKRYPKIINRYLGGSSEDKTVIRYIFNKRDKYQWTFKKIADSLNKQGKKTVCGVPFTDYLVYYKYKSNKKRNDKIN